MNKGSKFEFVIDKIENNSFFVSQIIDNNSLLLTNGNGTNSENSVSPYDGDGAATYIVVVVLVYGLSIIFFIGSQVRSTKKITDDVDGVNAEKVLRSMETEIFDKEVLQKLGDKHLREKAWKIYIQGQGWYKASNYNNEDITRKEIERIETKIKMNSIKKQASFKKRLSRKLSKLVFKRDASKTLSNAEDPNDEKFEDTKRFKNTTPLLVLQTDEDGLYKMRKAKLKKQKSFDESEFDINITPTNSMTRNKPKNNDATFDICEITEKISSV